MSDPDGFILAIDIGGTKLAAARVDPDGQVLSRQQVPTLPTGTGEGDALWSTLLGLIDEVCAGGRPVAVGVAAADRCGPRRVSCSPLNIPAWRDYPLRERLRERFPAVDIRLANDAIAMAVGEHWRGAGRDTASFLGIVVSTGVGGGLVLDGRVVEGRSGNAGHIGHVVVEPDGPLCACGGRGCLEAIARGPAVIRWALEQGWQPAGTARRPARRCWQTHVVATRSPQRRSPGRRRRRHRGRVGCTPARARGGGDRWWSCERRRPAARTGAGGVRRHVKMEFAARCRIVPAGLGVDAGLVGAAALVAVADQYWPIGAD